MRFQIFSGKLKIKVFCLFVIISLFLTLLFPGVIRSENNQGSNEISIALNTNNCPKELIVKLEDQILFCVKDTENLPDNKELKYWAEKRILLEKEANKFSSNIKTFADKKEDRGSLNYSSNLKKI